jgi:ABC-type uncharacterized transport system substrate-binding protein
VKRKFLFALLVTVLLTTASPAGAQQLRTPYRIGILFFGSRDQPNLAAFQQGLQELGHREGRDLAIEYRYAEGDTDRMSKLAADLVRLKVDVIVTTFSGSAQVVHQLTKTIPIVVITGDPVAAGLAQSLAKPGGNVTGLTNLAADLSGKRFDLLKETLSRMNGVSVLWNDQFEASPRSYKEVEDAASSVSLRLNSLKIHNADEIEGALSKAASTPRDPLLVILDPLMTINSKRIVQLAIKHQLPGMYPTAQFVEEGGLMSYGTSISALYRRAATYVDKILKGAKPADLPVEQPTKFEFVINLKTAKALDLTVPQSVLYRADRVIK